MQPGDATAHQVQPVVVLLDTARLADNDAVGSQGNALGNVVGAVGGAVFFVGREEQAEPTAGRGVAGQARSSYQLHGDAALHISGAKAVQPVSLDVRAEGIDAPCSVCDGLGVEVAREHEVPSSLSEIQGDEQVGPGLVFGDDPCCGELQRGQKVMHERGGGTFVAGWVGTGGAYQLPGDVEDVQTLRTRDGHHL